MTHLPLTGACMCGAVRFEIDSPLQGAGYCHCKRCQRRSGAAAAANGKVAPGSLRIIGGEELVREWSPPEGFVKAFCSECGSALYGRSQEDANRVIVRLGALDADPGVRPAYHSWVESAASWEPLPDDGLPRFPGPRR